MRSSSPWKEPRLLATALTLSLHNLPVKVFFWDRQWEFSEDSVNWFSVEIYPFRTKSRAPFEKGLQSIRFRYQLIKQFRGWIRTIAPRIVHACDQDMFMTAWVSGYKPEMIIYDIYDFMWNFHTLPVWATRVLRSLDRVFYRIADTIIVPDENRVDVIPAKFRKKVTVIPNAPIIAYCVSEGVIKPEPVKVPHREKDTMVIFYPGTLSKSRHVNWLLKAAEDLPWLEVWIAGWGPLIDTVNQYTRRLYPRVKYLGVLPVENIVLVYNHVDLLFNVYDISYPVNRKASPNKLFEALWMGVPVVACYGMGLEDIAEDIPLVHLIPHDYRAFVSFLKDFRSQDKSKLKSLQSVVRQWLLKRINAFTAGLKKVYGLK